MLPIEGMPMVLVSFYHLHPFAHWALTESLTILTGAAAGFGP